MAASVAKFKALGLAARTDSRNRTRSLRRQAHDIGAGVGRRNDEAKDEVRALTSEMAAIAEAAVAELERSAALVEQIAVQTRTRLSGEVPTAPPRSCPCTTTTPGTLPRDEWDAHWSSSTRPNNQISGATGQPHSYPQTIMRPGDSMSGSLSSSRSSTVCCIVNGAKSRL